MEIQILKKNSKKVFKKLAGINRDTSPAHINKLKASISKIGMVQAIIVADLTFITGKKETYIIEGQHKYEACMALGIDIPYTIIDNITNYEELVTTIALLNSSSKSWTMMDYVMAWSSIHNDFKRLMFYTNKYGLALNLTAAILSDQNWSIRQKHITTSIKSGNFRIKNEERAAKQIDLTAEVAKIVPRLKIELQRKFYSEFIKMMNVLNEKYDHKAMIGYLRKQKELGVLAFHTTEEVDKFFDDYFNFIHSKHPAEL